MKKALFIFLSVLLAVSCTKEAEQAAPGAVARTSITIDGVSLQNTAEVYVLTSNITVNSEEYPAFLAPANVDVYNIGSFCSGDVVIKPFIMGKYEVTQELYRKVMEGQKIENIDLNANPSQCKGIIGDGETQDYRPVDSISWYDAIYFCNVLSDKMGYSKAYTITVTQIQAGHIIDAYVSEVKGSNGYRLPSAEEWEFAARGGDPSKPDWNYMFAGSPDQLDSVGWYEANSEVIQDGDDVTHQVGKKKPNRLGLYDMTGNVCEWCYDTETIGDGGRLERGGGCQLPTSYQMVTMKYGVNPAGNSAYHDLGFRIVRSVK